MQLESTCLLQEFIRSDCCEHCCHNYICIPLFIKTWLIESTITCKVIWHIAITYNAAAHDLPDMYVISLHALAIS